MARQSYSLIRAMSLLAVGATLIFLALTLLIVSSAVGMSPGTLFTRAWRHLLLLGATIGVILTYRSAARPDR